MLQDSRWSLDRKIQNFLFEELDKSFFLNNISIFIDFIYIFNIFE